MLKAKMEDCVHMCINVLFKIFIQALPWDLFKTSNLIFMLNFRGTVSRVGGKKHQPAYLRKLL